MRRPLFFLILIPVLVSAGWVRAGADSCEIVLGVPTSLTRLEGRESYNAVILAAEEINAKGGVVLDKGRCRIAIKSADIRDGVPGVSPDAAMERLEWFLDQNEIHGLVVGPFRSEVLLLAMDAISKRKIPLLGTIAMSTATEDKLLRDPNYKYIFRVGLNADYLVQYLVENMKLLRRRFGVSRVFILNQDVAWARSSASMIMKLHLRRAGWDVLGQISYPSTTEDFSKGLKSAEESGAEVILCIFDDSRSGHLVKQWNEAGSKAILTGFISPMSGPGAWKTFDGKIAGALNVMFELGNLPSEKYPLSAEFTRRYAARFGKPIEAGHGPAAAYDSVYIFAEAASRARSLDPEILVSELKKTDHRGVMGRSRFHRGHQVVFGSDPQKEAVGCLVQWTENGQRRIVFPDALAEGKIEPPVDLVRK